MRLIAEAGLGCDRCHGVARSTEPIRAPVDAQAPHVLADALAEVFAKGARQMDRVHAGFPCEVVQFEV